MNTGWKRWVEALRETFRDESLGRDRRSAALTCLESLSGANKISQRAYRKHWSCILATDFKQSVQEGYVVCPFLQCGVEECQGSLDARRIFSVVFVLDGGLLCCLRVSATLSLVVSPEPLAPIPRGFLHCRRTGVDRPELSGDMDLRGPGSRAMAAGCGWRFKEVIVVSRPSGRTETRLRS